MVIWKLEELIPGGGAWLCEPPACWCWTTGTTGGGV
jgi:hypothetical protein